MMFALILKQYVAKKRIGEAMSRLKSIQTFLVKDRVFYGLLAIIIALFFLRLLNLECDLPGFGIALYQPFDEASYSRLSLNYTLYGSLDQINGYSITTGDTFKSIVVGNAFQALSFAVFGRNYYGMRLPYTICAFLSGVFLCWAAYKAASRYGLQKNDARALLLCIAAMVLFSFPFLMMSRVVEGSCIRALGASVFVWLLVITHQGRRIRYVALGFLSVSLIFFVYFSNVAPLFGIAAIIVYHLARKNGRQALRCLLYAGIGVLAALALAELYYLLVWNQGALQTFLAGTFGSFGDRVVLSDASTVVGGRSFFGGIASFFASNMFFYDLPFLAILLISIASNAWIAWKKNDELLWILLFVLLGMVLQSGLTDDYIERKAISIYPVCILLIVVFIATSKSHWMPNRGFKWPAWLKVTVAAGFPVVMIAMVLFMYRLREQKGYFEDFGNSSITFLTVATLVELVLLLSAWALLIRAFSKKKLQVNRKTSLSAAFLVLFACTGAVLAVNGAFSFRYYYGYHQYTEKAAMVSIGDIVGNEYVTSPYAYSVCLYNDIKPIASAGIPLLQELYMHDDINYMVDYSAPTIIAKDIDPGLANTEVVAVFPRSLSQLGTTKEIALYSKAGLR